MQRNGKKNQKLYGYFPPKNSFSPQDGVSQRLLHESQSFLLVREILRKFFKRLYYQFLPWDQSIPFPTVFYPISHWIKTDTE